MNTSSFIKSILDAKKSLAQDRKRTNLFRHVEQPVLAFLCRIMPPWVTPDMLTFIGFVGSCIVLAGFVLARLNNYYLLLSIGGFAVQWFGDSLDGRLAYYRNSPRKWFGFSLDMCMDWLSTILMGVGFYYFLPDNYRILALTFVGVYGWTMLIAILKFKITGTYNIDSGMVGPTELRLGICLILFIGTFIPQTLLLFAVAANAIVFLLNVNDMRKLLQLGDQRDKEENAHRRNRDQMGAAK